MYNATVAAQMGALILTLSPAPRNTPHLLGTMYLADRQALIQNSAFITGSMNYWDQKIPFSMETLMEAAARHENRPWPRYIDQDSEGMLSANKINYNIDQLDRDSRRIISEVARKSNHFDFWGFKTHILSYCPELGLEGGLINEEEIINPYRNNVTCNHCSCDITYNRTRVKTGILYKFIICPICENEVEIKNG